MAQHPLAIADPSLGCERAPWSVPPPPHDLQVPPGSEGLLPLALQCRWREVAQRCRQLTATDTAAALSIGTFHCLALLKLRMHDEAASEMAKLGALDDPAYLGTAAQGGVSVVPFALRILWAELPWRLGHQQETVDRLYALLEWCAAREQQADEDAAALGAPDGGGGSSVVPPTTAAAAAAAAATSHQQLWRRRHRDVLLRLANKHCRLQQYPSALRLLNRQLAREPTDGEAWAEAGTIMVLLGDLHAAQHTLKHAEQLLLQPTSGLQLTSGGCSAAVGAAAAQQDQARRQALVHRNRGLLMFLQQHYRGAKEAFGAALAANPTDAAAANNAALALQYSNHLSDAVAALEHAFQAHPAAMMQETIVTNLASQYELMSCASALATGQRMADWVAMAAPDDFDISATKSNMGA